MKPSLEQATREQPQDTDTSSYVTQEAAVHARALLDTDQEETCCHSEEDGAPHVVEADRPSREDSEKGTKERIPWDRLSPVSRDFLLNGPYRRKRDKEYE